MEAESRMEVVMGWCREKWEDAGQRLQTFSYNMNVFWGSNVQVVTIVNNTRCILET